MANTTNLGMDIPTMSEEITTSINGLGSSVQTIDAEFGLSGPTASRPTTGNYTGRRYFDTTLGRAVYWSSATNGWIDIALNANTWSQAQTFTSGLFANGNILLANNVYLEAKDTAGNVRTIVWLDSGVRFGDSSRTYATTIHGKSVSTDNNVLDDGAGNADITGALSVTQVNASSNSSFAGGTTTYTNTQNGGLKIFETNTTGSSKTIRVNGGDFNIVNSAYTAPILTLDDTGKLLLTQSSIPALVAVSGGYKTQSGTTGALSLAAGITTVAVNFPYSFASSSGLMFFATFVTASSGTPNGLSFEVSSKGAGYVDLIIYSPTAQTVYLDWLALSNS